mmetsp:Transcript_54894/g.146813  ORF Transcript_54894/g.146813 Transcript_54894/m.146813 type:complete len:223 (+) Transcript_54894:6285-6953(+)
MALCSAGLRCLAAKMAHRNCSWSSDVSKSQCWYTRPQGSPCFAVTSLIMPCSAASDRSASTMEGAGSVRSHRCHALAKQTTTDCNPEAANDLQSSSVKAVPSSTTNTGRRPNCILHFAGSEIGSVAAYDKVTSRAAASASCAAWSTGSFTAGSSTTLATGALSSAARGAGAAAAVLSRSASFFFRAASLRLASSASARAFSTSFCSSASSALGCCTTLPEMV